MVLCKDLLSVGGSGYSRNHESENRAPYIPSPEPGSRKDRHTKGKTYLMFCPDANLAVRGRSPHCQRSPPMV